MESPGSEEETHVLVEYAFEYTTKDGQLITIKPNERYILLRRTNDHWWHVRKSKHSQPFYIPAKYVKVLGSLAHGPEPPSEKSSPTTLLETSIQVGADQPPEYEYRFLPAAVQECKSDTSQCYFSTSGMGTTVPFEDDGKMTSSSGAGGGTWPTLSGSCGSLKPSYPTDSSHPLVCGGPSAEHIRPAVSLNDLARFTPPSHAGTGNSGLYKAASWAHPHPLLKNSSENIHKLMKDQVKRDVQGHSAQESCEKVATDPVYVNLQELQLEQRTATASSSESTLQPCLSSSLHNWETHTDTESGHLFYYNPVTGQTTWQSPFEASLSSVSPSHSHSPLLLPSPATPAEWDQYVDEASGQIFFYNTATGETSWDAPQVNEAISTPEMQPSFTAYNPVDQRPPTPETDYPSLSPDELEHYPEEDYSPVGSYKQSHYTNLPSTNQGWVSYGNQEDGSHYASDTVTVPGHRHSTSSGSSLDSSPFAYWSPNLSTHSGPKEEQLKILEKAGILYRTKTADKGKRLRKNWSCSWTVLEGGVLIFFKDSKHSATSSVKLPSVLSSPEHTVDLIGASLSWATKEKSSKKNVLELKTRDGSEYLIQHDSENIVSTWHNAISNSISRLPTDFPLQESEDNSADLKTKEQGGSSKEKESEKKSPAFWQSSSSLNFDSDSNKVRNKLRKFLLKRPTLQSLRERGYIKDQVFGCALQVLCDREKSTVPQFVRQCITTVEKRGLDIDGLYRINGNLATIQKLRYKVDRDEHLDLDDGRWDDVHVITGALKLFFRELPEPLFPFNHFDKFITAIKITDPTKRRQRLRELVHSLPPANRSTMRVLFQHLCRVIEFREENRMSLQSVAIVFGPTLLKPEAEEGNMTMYMVFQNQIVEQILSQFSYIFPES